MLFKRVLALLFSILLTFTPISKSLVAYAESLSPNGAANQSALDDEASAASPEAVSDSVDQKDNTDDASEADIEASIEQAQSTEDVLDQIEYVYVDQQMVPLGGEQYVAIGCAEELGDLVSASIELSDSDGATHIYDAANFAGSAALFEIPFIDELQVSSYRLSKATFTFSCSDVTYVADFSDDQSVDNSYSFEVVPADFANALNSTSDESEITAFVLDGEGNIQATDSLDEALAAAASDGDETGIALMDADGRSSTRENYLVVAIDPGHGGDDPSKSGYNSGATGNGLKESALTWSIASYLRDELSTYTGVTPYLVRDHYEDPGLYERVKLASEIGADVFVSVHINSLPNSSANGYEVWVPNQSSYNYWTHEEGTALGSKITSELGKLGLANRGVKTLDYSTSGEDKRYPDGSEADYYSVIRNSRHMGFPGLIVEHAFVSNQSDASRLASDAFRKQLGVADATGIARQYCLTKDSAARSSALVSAKAHVSNLGWESAVYDNKVAGTTGKSLNMEAFQLSLLNSAAQNGGVSYQANIDGSWQGWMSDGRTAGTTGQNKAIQAVQAKLTGEAQNKYDLYYRVHSAEFGWLGWAKNGESAGTSGYGYGIQAIEVVVVPKGGDAPGTTANAYQVKGEEPASISYQAHVSDVGWQGYTTGVAGTTGRSLSIEALRFSVDGAGLSGDLVCSAHVQDYGWLDAVASGMVAGTTGKSKRMEALRISLTGQLAEKYDVWYRVHSPYFGWRGWAKNGQDAGTKGYGYRAEAVEVRLLPKGSDAPGGTTGAFEDADKKDSVDSESIAIMGSSEVSPERMASYFKSIGKLYPSDVYSEKGAATIEEFCKIVDEEASVEGVRSDIVFAQAMHETGWLSFTGSVRVEQCNFAGLGAVDSSTGGATFDDVRTGIRAQVQHLKAYASKDSLVNECVDPRFSYVKRGCAPYLTDLNGKWAVPGTDYGQRIEKILVVLAK